MALWKALLSVFLNSMILSAAIMVFTRDWVKQGYIGLGLFGVFVFNVILILELEMKK